MTIILSKYSSAVACNSRSSPGINVEYVLITLFYLKECLYLLSEMCPSPIYEVTESNKERLGNLLQMAQELQPVLYLLRQSNHKVVENIGVKYNPLRVPVCLHVSSCAGVK